jgi:cytochrome c-type biogenesis protein CcmE
MKTSHIVLIIIVAVVGIGAIVSLMTESRSYADFKEAAKHPGKSFDVIGTLDTTRAIEYDAMKNPDEFSFWMYDDRGNHSKVVVNKPKPQDFEKSISVVISGKMDGDVFRASNILLKCPSKYQDQKKPEFEMELK